MERPIMYEPVEAVINALGSEEIVNKCLKTLEDLLHDAKDYDPDDDDRFDFD